MKHTLSPRQVQIMRALCRGLGAKEIAGELGVGTRTIEAHIQVAKARLGARNIVQAAVRFSLKTGPEQGGELLRDTGK